MPVTIADLLSLPGLGLRLLTGEPQRVVRWAHTVELPDPAPWLQGGELVLTTGLRLGRSAQAQREYADRLADGKVTGIGFGTGLSYDRAPTALVKQCAARGLVLVEVPLATPFLAVIQAVAAALAQEQNAAFRRVLAHQHQMTRAALGKGIPGILRHLAKALDAEVAVTDAHQQVLAAAPGDGAALVDRVRAEVGSDGSRAAGPLGLSVRDGSRHLMVQSLGVAGTRRGLLAVAADTEFTPLDQLLLTHAASLLSLELERPQEVVEAHRALRAAVLGTLLDGGLTAQAAHRSLRHLGFAPADRLVVLLLLQARYQRPALVQQAARSLDRLASCPYLLREEEDGVVVVTRIADLDTVLDTLEAAHVTIGVSGSAAPDDLSGALRAARYAAAQAKADHRRVARYGQLRLPALLADAAVRTVVDHLADDLLTPLAEHPVLYESLEAFLQHNGGWEPASRALGVHRHTLRHRMARVSELTGLDLESAQDRAALLLAVLSRRL
ncbi:PucR family transcriptional regulator [Streptomyces adustus]